MKPSFGVTLVELLVAVFIVGLLAALLLPAVQSAREASRRGHCANNLRQLGIATHAHHDAFKCFPYGTDRAGHPRALAWGWGATSLPFLEQHSLHEQLRVGRDSLYHVMTDPERRYLAETKLEAFLCPSSGSPPQNDFKRFTHASDSRYGDTACGTSDYLAVQGVMLVDADESLERGLDPLGMYWPQRRLSFTDVTDGTSQTFAIGERCWKDESGIWIGTRNDMGKGSGGIIQVFGCVNVPINVGPPTGTRGFSSEHPGGAQFVFVDGHVELISETISFNNMHASYGPPLNQSMGMYQRLGRRNDGLVIDY